VVCHEPEDDEFDASITGAHLLPIHSEQITGIGFTILDVTGVAPGQAMTVTFKITTTADLTLAPI
jgi:hypothetical protein